MAGPRQKGLAAEPRRPAGPASSRQNPAAADADLSDHVEFVLGRIGGLVRAQRNLRDFQLLPADPALLAAARTLGHRCESLTTEHPTNQLSEKVICAQARSSYFRSPR